MKGLITLIICSIILTSCDPEQEKRDELAKNRIVELRAELSILNDRARQANNESRILKFKYDSLTLSATSLDDALRNNHRWSGDSILLELQRLGYRSDSIEDERRQIQIAIDSLAKSLQR